MAKDSPNIFAETAGYYYEKGVSVIPLYRREKRPIPTDWSRWAATKVEEEQQRQWIDNFPDANIGLVLGPQSGVVMIDIDTPDEALQENIKKLLPPSPWVSVGQKGMKLAYKFSGLPTFRIKNEAGETLVEHLSERTQAVLPPSIHPGTGRPYNQNIELYKVLERLPALPADIETTLRKALEEYGVRLSTRGWTKVTEFVSSGSRDVQLTEKAGLFAYAVLRGERTLKEAVGMLRSFHTEFIEQVAGDEIDIDKHVRNLINFLHRDVAKGRQLPIGWDEDLTQEEREAWKLDFDSNSLEWSPKDIRSFLKDEFEKHPRGSDGRHSAIDHALFKIAMATSMNKLDEDRILQYIIEVGGTGMRMSSLRSQIREHQTRTVAGDSHQDIAQAIVEEYSQSSDIRHDQNHLWRWCGSHWEIIPDNVIRSKITKDYGDLPAARKANDIRGILDMVKWLTEKTIKTSAVRGVNFANGFLTEDLVLREHGPEYGVTYTLPFRYLPEEKGICPKFFKFLEDCWGEDEDYQQKVDALQEALCVTLFGMGPKFQRAILLKGVPKGGKSEMLKIAGALVPDEARCSVPPNEWGDKFMPAMMFGSLINICGELSNKKRIDGQKFKEIVDGTEMSGQFKGKDIFMFKPVCTHWFASNHTPKTEDSSDGFNRRWLILEFTRAVPKEKRKLDLAETIISEEREAIVAWAVEAMPRLAAQKEYTIPPSHEQLIREVAQENNSVRFFLEECPKVNFSTGSQGGNSSTGAHISETKLYNEYWAFCFGPVNVKPVNSRTFRSYMRELASEKRFELKITLTSAGTQECIYEGITLAG